MLPTTPVGLCVVLALLLGCSCILLLVRRQRKAREQATRRIIALQRKIDAALDDQFVHLFLDIFRPRTAGRVQVWW